MVTSDVNNSPVELEKKKNLFRTYQVIWYILGVIEVFLGLRLLLRFMGANPNSPFADFVYNVSYIFAAPFLTLFGNTDVGGSVLEWSTAFAMLIYWLIALGIVKVLQLSKPASKDEIIRKVDDPSVQI